MLSESSIVWTGFSTRAEYLAWVHAWRAEYARLAGQIRSLKRHRKQFVREGSSWVPNPHGYQRSANKKLHRKSIQATILLEVYAEAKIEAARQSEERHYDSLRSFG